jgi:hypothetical protein
MENETFAKFMKRSPSDSSTSSTLSFFSTMSEELNFNSYQKRASALVELVNKLRDTGASIELDLPTIVVSGNQRYIPLTKCRKIKYHRID